MAPKSQTLANVDQLSKVLQCFKSFDVNNDGKICRDELSIVLHEIDREGTCSGIDVSRVLDAMDKNKDGVIDYNEFVMWVEGRRTNVNSLLTAAESLEAQRKKRLPLQGFGCMRVESKKADGVTATNTAGSDWGGVGHGIAISTASLSSDKPYFVCSIERSRDNDGEGIYIGVAAIEQTSLHSGTPSGQCWVLILSTGQVWHGSGTLVDPKLNSNAETIFSDSLFEAGGTDITVLVDFAKSTLQFSINDGDFVDSGVKVHGPLQLYVHTQFLEDAISVYM